MSLLDFCMMFLREPVFPGEPQALTVRHYQSSSIQNGREWLVTKSLNEGASHILFIDDDIVFNAEAPLMMLRRRLPFVVGNYKLRFEGMPFAAFREDLTATIATTSESPDLEPCGACGFGLALIERRVFDAFPQPWFPTIWDADSRTYSTEDVPFFQAARRAGIIPMIDHAASRHLLHIGNYRYRWNDPRDSFIPASASVSEK